MIFTLFAHQWKSFWRGQNIKINVGLQIVSVLGFLYLVFLAGAVGVYLDEFIEEGMPGKNVMEVYCGGILYYFAIDILARFLFQGMPSIFIQPYLVQNIRKRQVINYLHLRTLFSLFNIMPFILLLPFIWVRVAPAFGNRAALAFTVAVVSLIFFNNFLVAFVKRKTAIKPAWLIGFIVVVIALAAADYLGYYSIRTYSLALFTGLFRYPAIVIAPLVLAMAAFYNEHTFLLRNFYLEEAGTKTTVKTSSDYSWLNRFGITGALVANEMKLLFRNKRTRGAFLNSFLFLFYGFLFYKNADIEQGNLGMIFFGSVFVTGTFIVQYAYLIFSAQCSFFDGLMSSNLKIRQYITAKYFFLVSVSTIPLLISFLYGFVNWKIIPIEIAGYCFNMGVTALLCLYFGTKNYKAVEIEKAATFNQRGFSIEQFLFPLVVAFIGVCIYAPFALFLGSWAGVIGAGAAGFISILLHRYWMNSIAGEFAEKKYKMLEGFRDK